MEPLSVYTCFMDRDSLVQNLAIVLMVFVTMFSVWLGFKSGQRKAQANLFMNNAIATSQGLENFYSDFDRFPTGLEFETKSLMINYFNYWPQVVFDNLACGPNLAYANLGFHKYQLNVCLPSKANGLAKGLQQFTISK